MTKLGKPAQKKKKMTSSVSNARSSSNYNSGIWQNTKSAMIADP